MPKLTSQEILDKRNTAVANMRAVLDKAAKDSRKDLNPDEETEYNGYKEEITKYNGELAASKKADERETFLREQEETRSFLLQYEA